MVSQKNYLPEIVEGPKLDKRRRGPTPKWVAESLRAVPHLTTGDVLRLAAAAEQDGRGHKGHRNQMLILVPFDACLRISEALGLSPKDLVRRPTSFRLRILGKGGKRAEVATLQEQLRHISPAMTLRYLKTLTREEALQVQESVDLFGMVSSA